MTSEIPTASPAASGAIGSFASADAAAVIEQLQDSPLLAEGRINMVSLAAIAARMSRKWPMRRELVHQHFERAVARYAGPAAMVLRLSETDYLVAQPDGTRLTGQVTCLNALRETLTHFLGEAQLLDIVVHQVTRLSKDAVYGERLDVRAVETDLAAEQKRKAAAPPASFTYRWSPFTATDGRELSVACELEPVLHLKTLKMIGHRVTREVLDVEAERNLTDRDLNGLRRADSERIDFATLQKAISRLGESGPRRDPTLILPVSLTTLCSQRGRSVLSDLYREAQTIVQHGLITEICDIEGAPSGRLMEAIAFVKPFSLYVIGRLSEPTTQLGTLKNAGLQGLAIQCPKFLSGAAFCAWLQQRRALLRAGGKTGIVYGLPLLLDHSLAGPLGITHGSLRMMERSDEGPYSRRETPATVQAASM